MAQGDVTVFEEAKRNLNLSAAATDGAGLNIDADTIKVLLVSEAIASVPASQATPDTGDFTECTAGGGYTTGGETCTVTVSEAAGTVTVALGSAVTWTSAGTGGPADIRTALFYSSSHTGTADCIAAMDMTTDAGTTPLDLDSGDITINTGNLFTF